MAEETGSTASGTGTANEHVSGVPAGAGPEETPGVTLVGIVLETAAGLRRALAPGIESELSVGGLAFEVLVRLVRSPGARLRMTDLAAQTGLTPGGLTPRSTVSPRPASSAGRRAPATGGARTRRSPRPGRRASPRSSSATSGTSRC